MRHKLVLEGMFGAASRSVLGGVDKSQLGRKAGFGSPPKLTNTQVGVFLGLISRAIFVAMLGRHLGRQGLPVGPRIAGANLGI